jgi:hypothetical protein
LGCVIWEMMTLAPAFNAKNAHLLNQQILRGLCSSAIPQGRYSDTLMTLAKQMIDTDTKRRPSIRTIMDMPGIRIRLQSSCYTPNDLTQYTVSRNLQTVIYPPLRTSDWPRACEELRDIIPNLNTRRREENINSRASKIYYQPTERIRVSLPRLKHIEQKKRPRAPAPMRALPKPTIPPWARDF